MNHTIGHREGKAPPLRPGMVFSQLEFVEQAALPAVVAPPLFLFQIAAPDQVIEGAFDGAAGELQIAGNGSDGGPAFAVFVGSIFEVHIHGFGAVRNFLGVDG